MMYDRVVVLEELVMRTESPDFVLREARLFRAGAYADKPRVGETYTASEADLDAMIAATRGNIPLDLHHADTDQTLPMGGIVPGSLRRKGDWLLGTVAVDRDIDEKLRHRGLSVVIDLATKALRKVTVTPRPAVPGASFAGEQPEAEGDVIAVFDGGTLMPEDTAAAKPQVDTVGPAVEEDEDEDEKLLNTVMRRWREHRKLKKQAAVVASMEEPPLTQADAERIKQEAKAEAMAEFATQIAPLLEERQAERVELELSRGVPEWVARPAVALLAETGEVAFAQANGETSKVKVAQFAADLLKHFANTTPRGRQMAAIDAQGLPAADSVEFGTRIVTRAKELRADTPTLSQRQAIELARKELGHGD